MSFFVNLFFKLYCVLTCDTITLYVAESSKKYPNFLNGSYNESKIKAFAEENYLGNYIAINENEAYYKNILKHVISKLINFLRRLNVFQVVFPFFQYNKKA